jgi:hypothetical protein
MSRSTSLLASKRSPVFFFMVFMSSPNILTLSAQTRIYAVPFNSNLSSFSWTFLMEYSKAKFKSNGNKASPYFRPFWIGNASERVLPMWTLE